MISWTMCNAGVRLDNSPVCRYDVYPGVEVTIECVSWKSGYFYPSIKWETPDGSVTFSILNGEGRKTIGRFKATKYIYSSNVLSSIIKFNTSLNLTGAVFKCYDSSNNYVSCRINVIPFTPFTINCIGCTFCSIGIIIGKYRNMVCDIANKTGLIALSSSTFTSPHPTTIISTETPNFIALSSSSFTSPHPTTIIPSETPKFIPPPTVIKKQLITTVILPSSTITTAIVVASTTIIITTPKPIIPKAICFCYYTLQDSCKPQTLQ